MAKVIEALAPRKLTKNRVWFAFAVAAITDAIQLGAGPAGGLFIAQVLDVIAMVAISLAIGFHPLLLPTFVLELTPLADMLPTWTGCTAAVVFMRRKTQEPTAPEQPRSEPVAPPPIDVQSEVTRVPPQPPS